MKYIFFCRPALPQERDPGLRITSVVMCLHVLSDHGKYIHWEKRMLTGQLPANELGWYIVTETANQLIRQAELEMPHG